MSHVVAVRLSDQEHGALLDTCRKNNVTMQALMRAIVLDALVDEGYDALRCEQSEGCESSAEISEGRGAAAEGSC